MTSSAIIGSMASSTRAVIVNMNPRGKVHETSCRWLTGAINSGGLNQASYKTMPANQVPSGKKHCSHC
jgi:hypothetical protein